MAAAEEERPTSSTSSFSQEEVDQLMSQGKRHFVCNEIVEAVKSFQEACRLLGEKYGQTANECGDAYFQYGKSLLELARVENGVLGNALKEVPIEESDSDEETKLNTVGPKIKDIPLEEKQAVKESVQSAMEEKETANKEGEGSTSEAKEDVAGGSGETTEPASKDATRESERVAKESEEATKGSEEATKESEEATKGSEEATKESEEATKGSEEATKGSEEATKGSEEATKGSEEATKGSEEATKGSEEATKGSEEATKESKETTKESEEATKQSKEKCSEEKKEVDESEDIAGGDEGLGEDIGEEAEDDTTKAQNGEEGKDDGEDVADEPIDADAVPTIQLAWEMLELARIIFKRLNNQQNQLKLAQTHLMLGEINMEQEQFTDAISETTKCLNIRKGLLQPDDRLLAETYYTLGLADGLSANYDKSAEHYSNANEVIELRIKNIKARMEKEEEHDQGKGKASVQDPYVKDRNEIAELEELLPEIKERCLDAKNENEKLVNDIKKQMGITSVGFGTSSSTNTSASTAHVIEPKKKADDINHLVRRTKRKPEEEEQTEQNQEVPPKKSRQDDESTTTQTQNGDSGTNSEAVAMEQQ